MSFTAAQARGLSYLAPALAIGIAIGLIAMPTIKQAKTQEGNKERSSQLSAIAKDYISKRCYSSDVNPVKNLPINGVTAQSLQSTCLTGPSWVGYVAVVKGQPSVLETFTFAELNAQVSLLKKEPKL